MVKATKAIETQATELEQAYEEQATEQPANPLADALRLAVERYIVEPNVYTLQELINRAKTYTRYPDVQV